MPKRTRPGRSYFLMGWIFSVCLHAVVVAGVVWVVTERYAQVPRQPFGLDVTLVENNWPVHVQAAAPAEPKTKAESAQAPGRARKPQAPNERHVRTPLPESSPPAPTPFIPSVEDAKRTDSARPRTTIIPPMVTGEQPSDTVAERDQMARAPIPRGVVAQPARTASLLPPVTRAAPSPEADFGWLAATMHRRITDLKRYPHAARVQRWEGKVVLRAVIEQDGHLADLRIQRSSGYDLLDQEAMDLVRRVCPLPLERTLGRPRVVMYVPITYMLES